MKKPATSTKRTTKDLQVRKDGAVKGGLSSAISTTIKSFGDALSSAARKG